MLCGCVCERGGNNYPAQILIKFERGAKAMFEQLKPKLWQSDCQLRPVERAENELRGGCDLFDLRWEW